MCECHLLLHSYFPAFAVFLIMSLYAPGDRVWVYIEGDGWWPARVLSDTDIGTRTRGQDIAVQFYPGIDTPASLYELNSHGDAAHISFFETSSEKAVTSNAELEAAIRHATEDTDANPLKTDDAISASRTAAGMSGGAAHGSMGAPMSVPVNRGTAKRMREMGRDDFMDNSGHGAASSAPSSDYQHLPPNELHRLSKKIASAVEGQNLAKVRAALCQLDRVDVFLDELEDTKIGIAVGSVLNYASLKPLWPLARAIISFWARHLPKETLTAIRSVKQQDVPLDRRDAADVGSPNEPSSPVGTQSPLRKQPGSPGVSSGSAFDHLSSPSTASARTTVAPQKKSFYHNVRQMLDNPDNTVRYDDAVLDDVARKIASEIVDRDDRQELLMRLRQPEMEFLRMRLLSGEWTPKKYLEQPNEIFLSEKQKAEEAQRVTNKMKAVDAAQNAGLNLTHLFKCERCGKRECTYFELQVRGADEPTTKYVTCLNCKNAWSQE